MGEWQFPRHLLEVIIDISISIKVKINFIQIFESKPPKCWGKGKKNFSRKDEGRESASTEESERERERERERDTEQW